MGLDWLKRRISEVLRAGRVSAVLLAKGEGAYCVEVEGCCDGAAMWDEASVDESGGCGKWLRTGSYWRLFAKSSKVTSGMKSKRSPASAGASGGCACDVKLKREAASLAVGKARPWGAMLPASLVTLQSIGRQHAVGGPLSRRGTASGHLTFVSRMGAGPAALCGLAPTVAARGSLSWNWCLGAAEGQT